MVRQLFGGPIDAWSCCRWRWRRLELASIHCRYRKKETGALTPVPSDKTIFGVIELIWFDLPRLVEILIIERLWH